MNWQLSMVDLPDKDCYIAATVDDGFLETLVCTKIIQTLEVKVKSDNKVVFYTNQTLRYIHRLATIQRITWIYSNVKQKLDKHLKTLV